MAIPVAAELRRLCWASASYRGRRKERFETVMNGEVVIENPLPGEVIWRDDAGRHMPALELAAGHAHRLTQPIVHVVCVRKP